MANETFDLNTADFYEVLSRFRATGVDVESVLNDYIHNEAPKKIRPSITGLIPISKRNKKHARNSDPFSEQENWNLAVKVNTSKEFNYLVFPDEGIGNSSGYWPEDFTGRGLEAVTSELIDDMTQKIMDSINK